jgi:hypothetical protein
MMAGLDEDTEPSESHPTKVANVPRASKRAKGEAALREPKTSRAKKAKDEAKPKSREVIWGRITPILLQQLEAYAKTHKLSKSEVIYEALSMFLERRNDEVAWERAMLRIDRRLGGVEELMQRLQEVQLWHLRKYLTLAGPVPEPSKGLYEETGNSRYARFLKDMDAQLGQELRRELYSVGRPGAARAQRAGGEKP